MHAVDLKCRLVTRKTENKRGGKEFLRLLAVKSRKYPSPSLSHLILISYIYRLIHMLILSVHCYEDDISSKLERIQGI